MQLATAAKMYHFETFVFNLSDCASNNQDDLALKYLRRYKVEMQQLDGKDIVGVIVSLDRELYAEKKPLSDSGQRGRVGDTQ